MNTKRLLSLLLLLALLTAVLTGVVVATPTDQVEVEPNNSMDTATTITFGDTAAAINPAGDFDYFQFEGHAGDIVHVSLTAAGFSGSFYIRLDSQEARVAEAKFLEGPGTVTLYRVLPRDGMYFVRVNIMENETATYQLGLERHSLYVVADKAGQVDGVNFQSVDVLAKNQEGNWELVFDGSDLGITQPLMAFDILTDGNMLFTLQNTQSISGLGQVTPQDIIHFGPTSLGEQTAGVLSWYLDGSDVGLTQLGEKIDAIARTPEGGLLLSTTGSASVPKLGGGTHSTGSWSMYFDGTAWPLTKFGSEDLRGAQIPPFSVWDYEELALLMGLQNAYELRDEPPGFLGQKATAHSGDLIMAMLWRDPWSSHVRLWIALEREALGFSRVVQSFAEGPGWGN